MEMQKVYEEGIKESLTEASLGWKCFGLYNRDREFHTFKNKYVRDFIRKSSKGLRTCAPKRYFELTQVDEKLLTTKKHLNIYNNEISTVTDKILRIYIDKGKRKSNSVYR